MKEELKEFYSVTLKLPLCTTYDNAPSTPQAAAFFCIQSADYPETEAGQQAKAARLRY
jgi:hypothetical protein